MQAFPFDESRGREETSMSRPALVPLKSLPSGDRIAGLMKNRAYADIKRLILDETIGPGEFLSERQLAARLQMSKTPIKSALERLEAEGFIGVSPPPRLLIPH